MGIAGALIHRGAGRVSPAARARLACAYEARHGEFGLVIARSLVRPGDVVVDVGANYGLYTEQLARLVGQSGKVHSFEPDPVQLRKLERVVRRRHNVILHPFGASDRDGQATLRAPIIAGKRMGSRATLRPLASDTPTEEIAVELRRLDSVVTGPVTFIKCDAEGHEPSVLRGGEKLLEESRPSLLIELDQRYLASPIRDTVDYLVEFGYEGYGLLRDGLRPVSELDLTGNRPPSTDEAPVDNFLFVQPGIESNRLLPSIAIH